MTLMPIRAGVWIRFGPSRPSTQNRFQRLVRGLGYARHFKTCSYIRPWSSTFGALDEEVSRVLTACRAGKVERRERRPMVREILRRPGVHVLKQEHGRDLIDWLSTRTDQGWRPEMLFLRQEKRMRADDVDWIVDCDGYWEPPDRNGLEVVFSLMSRRPMSPRTWRRLKTEGFIERVGRELKEFDLRPRLRPRLGMEDFEGISGGHYLATFERNLPKIEEVESAVRPMMKWPPT